MDDFLSCEPLCGSSRTAVRCDSLDGLLALERIRAHDRWAYESTESTTRTEEPYEGALRGCWRWDDLASSDAVELLNFPGGVPGTKPAAAVRSSLLDDGRTHISHYVHATRKKRDCLLHLGIASSWTPIRDTDLEDGPNLKMAFLLLEHSGECPNDMYDGMSWKREGWLIHPDVIRLPDFEDIACGEDGMCVGWCRVDHDCPCHKDGRCDPYGCIGDRECECVSDNICIPGCEEDPDCACIEDGECNTACLTLDPDCPCREDDCCSFMCLSGDPDCGCREDGACRTVPCGWLDPDCRCARDSTCNEACADGKDPDCEEDR